MHLFPCNRLVDTSDVSELQLKHDDFELVIRKKEALAQPTPPPPAPVQYPPYYPPQYAMPPPPPPAASDPVASAPSGPPAAAGLPALPAPSGPAKSSLPPLKSPMAGTFYRSPAPNAPPFVKVIREKSNLKLFSVSLWIATKDKPGLCHSFLF